MKKQNSAIIYGLIGAAIIIVLGLVMQMSITSSMKKAVASGDSISPFKFLWVGIISFLVIAGVYIFFIIRTIKDYRKTNPGYTYGKLVGQGLLVTLIISLVSTGFSLLYSQVIDPGAAKESIELTEKVFDNMDMPDEQKEKALEGIRNQDPVRQAVKSLAITLFCGLIVSLITASVLRKKEFPSNPNLT
jgi:Na+/H+-dicarboxylate symporter